MEIVQIENIELGVPIILMKSIGATVHLILGVIGAVVTVVLAIMGTIVPGVVRTTALTEVVGALAVERKPLGIDREALVTGIRVPVTGQSWLERRT